MSAPRLLRHADRPASPWANGGGVTYQVLVWPEGAGFTEFEWRISFAEVASEGPFSTLPGVDRILVLVEGRGMELSIDGSRHLLPPMAPIAFTGEAVVESRLPWGPTVDFNVMARRGHIRAEVRMISLDGELACSGNGPTQLLAVLDGSCRLDTGDAFPLLARDCLLVSEPYRLLGRATLAEVTLQPWL